MTCAESPRTVMPVPLAKNDAAGVDTTLFSTEDADFRSWLLGERRR